MSTWLYEIVELADNKIALQRADKEGEPLVCISFSKEAMSFIRDGKGAVAKAMIEAGMAAASELANAQTVTDTNDEQSEHDVGERLLH